MKLKMFLLVGALLLGGVASASEDITVKSVDAGGTIMFTQDLVNGEPTGQQCTLPVEGAGTTRTYNFRTKDTHCNNDVMTFFRVDNAPSAVLFQLRSDAAEFAEGECKPDEDTRWIFRLRTTRNKTTTGWISIPGLRGRPDKDIVDAGGVRLESNQDKGGNIKGKLSCVIINY